MVIPTSEDFSDREPRDAHKFTGNRNEHRPRVSPLENHDDQTCPIILVQDNFALVLAKRWQDRRR